MLFEGWKERTQPVTIPEDYEAPRVSAAQTWYLTVGYKLGPPISVWDVPGTKRPPELHDAAARLEGLRLQRPGEDDGLGVDDDHGAGVVPSQVTDHGQ